MVTGSTRRGTLKRNRRAREQDLALVMGNDPARAIIELVTNADDAYDAIPKGPRRKIRIEVERHRSTPTIIRVRDRANSMGLFEAEERLGEEGGRTSGFESGADRRGLLGRGAKDVVHFGPVEWDLKTPTGEHSVFRLLYNGASDQDWESEPLGRSDPKNHGTDVTLEIEKPFSVPLHENLLQSLSRNYAMRPILLNRKNREVVLVDRGQNLQNRLVYEPPAGTPLLENETVEIPGFPGIIATINLTELAESADDGRSREFWLHSLLITSGRAAYDVFEGKFRQEPWRNFLGKLWGTVDVPGINQLIREFDDRAESGEDPDASNPGLVRDQEHPFAAALTRAIEEVVKPHLDRIRWEQEESRTPVSPQTRRRNEALGRLFGRLLDEEEHGVDGGSGARDTMPPLGLSIIPGSRVVPADAPAWVTIRYRAEPDQAPSEVPEVDLVITDEQKTVNASLELLPRSGYFSRGYNLGAPADGDISSLSATLNGYEADCIVEWQQTQIEPVTAFEFEHSRYSVKDGQTRMLRLLAVWDIVSSGNNVLEIQMLGSPNVTQARGAGDVQSYPRRDCAMWEIEVRGWGIGSAATLTARLGAADASAQISVNASGAGDLKIEIENHQIPQCAWMSSDGSKLVINASSPSIARYLGDPDQNWPGQEGLHFRTMLAEIATQTVARHVVQSRHQQGREDVYTVFGQHMRLVEKWLPRVHNTLVPTQELRSLPNAN